MEKESDIRITNPSPQVKEELKNIAKYEGVTLTQFLKPKLRAIVDSYPEEIKNPKPR